jgi:hypothetical protein
MKSSKQRSARRRLFGAATPRRQLRQCSPMAHIPDLPAFGANTTAALSAAQLAGGGGRPRRDRRLDARFDRSPGIHGIARTLAPQRPPHAPPCPAVGPQRPPSDPTCPSRAPTYPSVGPQRPPHAPPRPSRAPPCPSVGPQRPPHDPTCLPGRAAVPCGRTSTPSAPFDIPPGAICSALRSNLNALRTVPMWPPRAPTCSARAPTCLPGAPTCPPRGSTCLPGAPTCLPGAPTCLPGAPTCLPGAPTCLPGAPTCLPRGTDMPPARFDMPPVQAMNLANCVQVRRECCAACTCHWPAGPARACAAG